jgi:hypothetical protein
MLEAVSQPPVAVFWASELARWDNEGGALSHPVPVKPPLVNVAHHLSDHELVCLHSRVIALENIVVAMLAGGSADQRAVVHDMALFVHPPLDAVQDRLTMHAADLMDHLADRATRFARILA